MSYAVQTNAKIINHQPRKFNTMKEITFDELIEEKLTATKEGYVVYSDDIKELLQQVREATIAEFQQKVTYRIGGYLGDDKLLNNIPTDRIKTEIKQ